MRCGAAGARAKLAKGWFSRRFGKSRIREASPISDNVQDLLEQAVALHREGSVADAKVIYDRILAIQPGHFDTLHLSGVIQYQCGQHADAVRLVKKAIEVNPNQAPPYSNLGLALQKLGRPQDALISFNRALVLQPQFVDALFNRGNVNRELGHFQEALNDYDGAIALRPDYPAALSNRGLTLGALNRTEEAVASFDKALAVDPDHIDAHINRGAALCVLNRHEEALANFDRVIALYPAHAEAHNNRGAALGGLSRHEDALASYDRALACKPSYAEALYNQGVTLGVLQRYEASLASYDAALSVKPHYPEALNGRGTTIRDLGRQSDALASYDRALSLKPDFPEALDNRGSVLMSLARHEEALAAHDMALALRPEFPQALSNRATVLREIGEQSAAMKSYRAAVRADPASLQLRFKLLMACIPVLAEDAREIELSRTLFGEELRLLQEWLSSNRANDEDQAVGAMQPFHLAYQDINNRELLRGYGELCTSLMAEWQRKNGFFTQAFARRSARGHARIRLGIVSAHVHNHSVWNAIVKGWVQKIDRRKFEIDIFYLGTSLDDQTKLAESSCDHFESGAFGLAEWTKRIAKREPDVLIYPEVGMDAMTSRLASMRLAPMQIAAWGHPETTGFSTIDFYLSADGFEAPHSQECYTEKLVPLPNLGCYYEPEVVSVIEIDLSEIGIDPGSPVFICPGTPFKYAPQHDSVFVDIARRLENAQFVFFSFGPTPLLSGRLAERLKNSFEAANLDFSSFVKFIPWQPKADFYALLRQADVFLDTIGFSGFNTAMQAIECGLPIVTCEGRFMRGRFASAILRRMDLGEAIADSDASYVETAVRLVRDRRFNEHVRKKIVTSRHVLYCDEASINALETFIVGLTARSRR